LSWIVFLEFLGEGSQASASWGFINFKKAK
jgi:hypothetical protein